MPTDRERARVHPLTDRQIAPARNWHEFLVAWNSERTLAELEGLLHYGYLTLLRKETRDEPEYSEADRALFYLSIADGWNNSSLFEARHERQESFLVGFDDTGKPIRMTPSEMRQKLARKAFDMLCLNFFRMDEYHPKTEYQTDWEEIVASAKLLPVIQAFFQIEEDKYSFIKNLSRNEGRRSRNENLAVSFLLNLANFLWMWESGHSRIRGDSPEETRTLREEMQQRIESAKPWMVAALSKLGKLEVLRARMLVLEPPCLDKLRQIALSTELRLYSGHRVSEDRHAVTIEEACYAGSNAAWFLKEHELITREHERLSAILAAERARSDADRQIADLSSR